jgi:hypothetical protein
LGHVSCPYVEVLMIPINYGMIGLDSFSRNHAFLSHENAEDVKVLGLGEALDCENRLRNAKPRDSRHG